VKWRGFAVLIALCVCAAPVFAQTPTPASPAEAVARAVALLAQGQYDAARAALRAVLQFDPSNRDALVALVDVELASERPRTAMELAEDALRTAPNSGRLLEARRRAVDAVVLLRPWLVGGGSTADWARSDGKAWRDYTVFLGRMTRVGPLRLRGVRSKRGGEQDDQFDVEFAPRLARGTYAYLSGSVAPDERLYPKRRIAADLSQALGAGIELTGGYRRLDLAGTSRHTYVAGLSKYIGKWVISARGYVDPDNDDVSGLSYHGIIRRDFGPDGISSLAVRYSRGFPREEVRSLNDLEVTDATTVAMELHAELGRRAVLGLAAGTSDQVRIGVARRRQNSVAGTLGFRF
jgi:YaiO family outer membrane protein